MRVKTEYKIFGLGMRWIPPNACGSYTKIPPSALYVFWHCQRVNRWTNSPVFEFQSRYIEHHFEARVKLPPIFGVSVYRLFVLPITTKWPSEWDMIFDDSFLGKQSETTPLKKQGQERHSGRTAKRKMMSLSVASIGLWPPQSKSTA